MRKNRAFRIDQNNVDESIRVNQLSGVIIPGDSDGFDGKINAIVLNYRSFYSPFESLSE